MTKSESDVCGGIPNGYKQIKVAYVKQKVSQKQRYK